MRLLRTRHPKRPHLSKDATLARTKLSKMGATVGVNPLVTAGHNLPALRQRSHKTVRLSRRWRWSPDAFLTVLCGSRTRALECIGGPWGRQTPPARFLHGIFKRPVACDPLVDLHSRRRPSCSHEPRSAVGGEGIGGPPTRLEPIRRKSDRRPRVARRMRSAGGRSASGETPCGTSD